MHDAPNEHRTPGEAMRLSATLQAILEDTQGLMQTVAVPLPLPEAIAMATRWFLRERSADSVLRYREQPGGTEAQDAAAPERCAACGARREPLFVVPAGGREMRAMPSRAVCLECYLQRGD